MEKEKVNMILMQYKDSIPNEKIVYLKSALEKADDSSYDNLSMCKTYNITTTILLSVFVGALGVDRFYIGDFGLGICKLLFGWVTFGIWPLVDIFCSYKKTKEKNFNNIITCL